MGLSECNNESLPFRVGYFQRQENDCEIAQVCEVASSFVHEPNGGGHGK